MGADAGSIVLQNRLAETRGFTQADRAGDDRFKHLVRQVTFYLLDDLTGKIGADVEHRHDDSADLELGIDSGFLELVDHLQDLPKTFHCQVFRLQRDQQVIRGGETVHRQHAERGRAIEDDGAIFFRGDQSCQTFA